MNAPSVRQPATVTDYMSEDHERLERLLGDATNAIHAGLPERARVCFGEYESGLNRHFRLEEELLFPLFEARTGVSSGPTLVLREEHVEVKSAVQAAGAALSASRLAFDEARGAMLQLLREHSGREERVLFPMLDRQLLPSERASLVARLVRE